MTAVIRTHISLLPYRHKVKAAFTFLVRALYNYPYSIPMVMYVSRHLAFFLYKCSPQTAQTVWVLPVFFLCGNDYKNVAPDHKPIDLKVMMGASEIYWTRRE